MIDWQSKAGIFGYGNGGMATNLAAAYPEGIGAAVSMHPRGSKQVKSSKVPILLIAGSYDLINPPREIEPVFHAAKAVPAAYAQLSSADHDDFFSLKNPYPLAMFDCHLKHQHASCAAIYSLDPKICPLCSCKSFRMDKCFTKNFKV